MNTRGIIIIVIAVIILATAIRKLTASAEGGPTDEQFKEINKRAKKERAEERERQKKIPKESVYKSWWFVGIVLPMLFLLIYIVGMTTIALMIYGEESAPQASLIVSMFNVFLILTLYVLMIFKVCSLSRKTTGEVFWATLIFVLLAPDLFGLLPLIFGVAWLVKTTKEKNLSDHKSLS